MKFLIVFVAVVAAVYGSTIPEPIYASFANGRIINGKDAEPNSAPYIVSIKSGFWFLKNHSCGGSLIAPDWVLTAAHCIGAQQMDVVAGLHNRRNERDSQVIRVVESIKHPKYTGGVGPFDIGLLRLEKSIKLTKSVQVVKLPAKDAVHNGDVDLYGWGKTGNGMISMLPNILQTVRTTIVNYEECKQALPADAPVHPNNICSGSLGENISACNGDSGGPLVQTNENGTELVGLVSWGYMPCGDANMPSVYTKVSSYIDWISENMQ